MMFLSTLLKKNINRDELTSSDESDKLLKQLQESCEMQIRRECDAFDAIKDGVAL